MTTRQAATGSEPIDRNDLAMFKDWVASEFKNVETRLVGVEKGIDIAAHEQERRDEQLNDVRLRFIPRAEFEAFETAWTKRTRAVNIALATVSVGLMGVGLTVVGLLTR